MKALVATLAITFLPSQVSGNPVAFDVQDSRMIVYVDKRGLFSFLADDHEIAAPIASGFYDAAARTVELTVAAARLQVLDPKLSSGKRAEAQEAMNTEVLDVQRYPAITFHSTDIEVGAGGIWLVRGDLTLHGRTRSVSVNVVQNDPTHFSGSSIVRQTDFGIAPIRVVGGTVTVKDDVRIVFRIALAG